MRIKKVMKYLNSFIIAFNNLKLRNKLLIAFMLLIFVPIAFISILSNLKTSEIIENQIIESTRQSFEQTNTFISYRLSNVKDVSSMLYMNKDIQNILKKDMSNYSIKDQIDDYSRLQEIINSVQNSKDVFGIRIYVGNGSMYSKEGISFIDESSVKETVWYKNVLDAKGAVSWRPTYTYNDHTRGLQKLISCMRTINSEGFSGRSLGAVSVDVSEDSIYQIIKQANSTWYGELFLIDNEGNIISSLNREEVGTNIASEKIFEEISNLNTGYKRIVLNRKPSILFSRQLELTGWQLVAIIPLNEILLPSKQVLNYLLTIIIFVTLIAVTVAFYISNGITKRIHQLISNMRKIKDENWDVYISVDSNDEIGILQKHFNYMVGHIKRLISEKYQSEIDKKSAELKALQAQINPHFLYNTLDMVNWLSYKYNAQDISSIIESLAKFFKISLSNGRDIISIKDELKHVEIYLDIQNKRFDNSIGAIFDISEEIYELATVKLILQPIVENAILHGIQEKQDKKGSIRIAGRREKDRVLLEVEDDGVGINEETLKSLLHKSNTKGYGVKNVNERIKLYFGENNGLSYESEPGKGTKVTIVFPAVPYI
jgi:two-component system, sensor histidine kinase YesM